VESVLNAYVPNEIGKVIALIENNLDSHFAVGRCAFMPAAQTCGGELAHEC
jgi:hypothetical protein